VSQENVEAIRRGNAAFSCAEWDTLAANMDQQILIRTDRRWPEQYIYGLEAALTWWRGLSESGGRDARIEEVVDLGDRVLARLRWTIRGQLSGIEGEQLASVIYTFRDGRVILEEFFLDRIEALKAVGLSE
jgi:ketosteroid isomerase-like protein